MFKKEVCIKGAFTNRDASLLVQCSMRYDSEIILEQSTKRINAKSIMGVISLGLKAGSYLVISAVGDDEQTAVTELSELITSGFKQ